MSRFLETPACPNRVLVVEGATTADLEFMIREQEHLAREHERLAEQLRELANLSSFV